MFELKTKFILSSLFHHDMRIKMFEIIAETIVNSIQSIQGISGGKFFFCTLADKNSISNVVIKNSEIRRIHLHDRLFMKDSRKALLDHANKPLLSGQKKIDVHI